MKSNRFSRWRSAAILDLLSSHLYHRYKEYFVVFAKFGWNRCISFCNEKVLIFYAFGLKMPIQPQNLAFGGSDPINGEQYQRHPQRN